MERVNGISLLNKKQINWNWRVKLYYDGHYREYLIRKFPILQTTFCKIKSIICALADFHVQFGKRINFKFWNQPCPTSAAFKHILFSQLPSEVAFYHNINEAARISRWIPTKNWLKPKKSVSSVQPGMETESWPSWKLLSALTLLTELAPFLRYCCHPSLGTTGWPNS